MKGRPAKNRVISHATLQEMANKNPSIPSSLSATHHESYQQVSIAMEMTDGPLPSASALQKYAEVFPDLPAKIVAMAEAQQSHRLQLEAKRANDSSYSQRVGLWIGFALSLVMMAVTWRAIEQHQPWVASVIGGGTIVTLVSLFVKTSAASSAEIQNRRRTILRAQGNHGSRGHDPQS